MGPLSGSTSLGSCDDRFTGGPYDQAGTSVDAADLDGDGLLDLFLGAMAGGSADQGAAYVLLGNTL